MRNIFDQFSQPENKLTHALASTLAMDGKLARNFAKWAVGLNPEAGKRIWVSQQNVPGDPGKLGEGDRRSLPDCCLFIPERWCLVIESKVTAPVVAEQLMRHRQMVRRSFLKVEVLALTADSNPPVPKGVHHRTWEGVFQWLSTQPGASEFWGRHLREFMRLMESQFLEKGVTLPGALTTFDGVPFGPNHPYSYLEAKLLLKQAMDILRKRPRLKSLGRNPTLVGRPAISGANERMVWDLLSLAPKGDDGKFTEWPHLTLGILQDKVEVMLTLPNGARTRFRKALTSLGRDGFLDLLTSISNEILRVGGKKVGTTPTLLLLQRHYPSRKIGVEDGRMKIDLRTISTKKIGSVKSAPAWAGMAFDLFVRGGAANLQMQIGAEFLHASKGLQGKEAIDRIEAVWLACKPLFQLISFKAPA